MFASKVKIFLFMEYYLSLVYHIIYIISYNIIYLTHHFIFIWRLISYKYNFINMNYLFLLRKRVIKCIKYIESIRFKKFWWFYLNVKPKNKLQRSTTVFSFFQYCKVSKLLIIVSHFQTLLKLIKMIWLPLTSVYFFCTILSPEIHF